MIPSGIPQTIWQKEGGCTRLRSLLSPQFRENELPADLVLYDENFDNASEPHESGWYVGDSLSFDADRAMAAKVAIDSYLLQTGAIKGVAIEPIPMAAQAINRLVGYCRSVRIDTKAPFNPDDGEPKCWQMEGWCLGLLEEADRVAALLEAVTIEPAPPTESASWSCEHSFGAHADPDLVVNISADTTGSNPTWILCDKWGEEILIDRDAMAWLAHLLPQIQRDYQQAIAEKNELPMEGMA